MKKPFILITNDDGIHAPGIKHLWNALKDFAELSIIAPQTEQSSVSLSITIRDPIHIQSIYWPNETPAWSVSGTPADCIKMALGVILKKRPDFIVSGINRGTNSGRNVLYSGTVGGAIEAVFQGIPGIAFSHSDYTSPNFNGVEQHIPKIIHYVQCHPLPHGTMLNVNFPLSSLGTPKGFKMARQGKAHWAEKPDQRLHPSEGHSYYWMGSCFREFDQEEPEGDVSLLSQGYITAVPVHIGELTDRIHYEAQKEHFNQFFNG